MKINWVIIYWIIQFNINVMNKQLQKVLHEKKQRKSLLYHGRYCYKGRPLMFPVNLATCDHRVSVYD